MLLDEAGNIAPLRDLPSYAATARSHGITLVSIWQDLAQIKAIYGAFADLITPIAPRTHHSGRGDRPRHDSQV